MEPNIPTEIGVAMGVTVIDDGSRTKGSIDNASLYMLPQLVELLFLFCNSGYMVHSHAYQSLSSFQVLPVAVIEADGMVEVGADERISDDSSIPGVELPANV